MTAVTTHYGCLYSTHVKFLLQYPLLWGHVLHMHSFQECVQEK